MTHWSERHKIVPAAYVLIERDGKTLFLRRSNTGYMDGHYSIPAGHLDGSEAPSVAAAREVSEEVGLSVQSAELELVHIMIYMAVEGDHERVSLFFRAKHFTGEPRNVEPHKCDSVDWFLNDALPADMVWEVRHALEQIAEGHVYSEVY